MLRRTLIAISLVALAVPGVANAQNPILRATVGPGAVITMTDAAGNPLANIPVGTYDIVVNDRSADHNFHLSGPGVNRTTTVSGTESLTWTVTFSDGVYRFQCDPHAADMNGSFSVGTGVNPQPPPPPPPPPPPAGGGGSLRGTLVATVGPRATIRLTRGGSRVRTLRPGRYRIRVFDRSHAHNFHLVGPRVNRKTSLHFMGRATWTVVLRRGTYRFACDPHARAMKGSFRVR